MVVFTTYESIANVVRLYDLNILSVIVCIVKECCAVIVVFIEPVAGKFDSDQMESVIKQKMICYADLLHGDEPAEKIADEIYQFPRLSRSFLGAREHKAMLSKPEFIISLRGYLDGMKSDGMTAITANDMRVFP